MNKYYRNLMAAAALLSGLSFMPSDHRIESSMKPLNPSAGLSRPKGASIESVNLTAVAYMEESENGSHPVHIIRKSSNGNPLYTIITSVEEYEYYKNMEYRGNDYARFVVPVNFFIVESYYREQDDSAEQPCMSNEELADEILRFVTGFKYIRERTNYPKYPIQTLLDGGGDCEDLSILYSSILHSAGIKSILLMYPKMEDENGNVTNSAHVLVGVNGNFGDGDAISFDGRNYYITETTGYLGIGITPESRRPQTPYVIPPYGLDGL